MNITIYTHKTKKSFIKEANNEYLKRLSRYCKIKTIETKDYKKELDKISNQTQLKNNIYTINVTSNLTTITSEQFSDYINDLAVNRNSKICIFLNANNHFNFDRTLTFSNMDIDTELLCTIVLEQIYRAYKILGNEPYHK